jgi:hypothetical protein
MQSNRDTGKGKCKDKGKGKQTDTSPGESRDQGSTAQTEEVNENSGMQDQVQGATQAERTKEAIRLAGVKTARKSRIICDYMDITLAELRRWRQQEKNKNLNLQYLAWAEKVWEWEHSNEHTESERPEFIELDVKDFAAQVQQETLSKLKAKKIADELKKSEKERRYEMARYRPIRPAGTEGAATQGDVIMISSSSSSNTSSPEPARHGGPIPHGLSPQRSYPDISPDLPIINPNFDPSRSARTVSTKGLTGPEQDFLVGSRLPRPTSKTWTLPRKPLSPEGTSSSSSSSSAASPEPGHSHRKGHSSHSPSLSGGGSPMSGIYGPAESEADDMNQPHNLHSDKTNQREARAAAKYGVNIATFRKLITEQKQIAWASLKPDSTDDAVKEVLAKGLQFQTGQTQTETSQRKAEVKRLGYKPNNKTQRAVVMKWAGKVLAARRENREEPKFDEAAEMREHNDLRVAKDWARLMRKKAAEAAAPENPAGPSEKRRPRRQSSGTDEGVYDGMIGGLVDPNETFAGNKAASKKKRTSKPSSPEPNFHNQDNHPPPSPPGGGQTGSRGGALTGSRAGQAQSQQTPHNNQQSRGGGAGRSQSSQQTRGAEGSKQHASGTDKAQRKPANIELTGSAKHGEGGVGSTKTHKDDEHSKKTAKELAKHPDKAKAVNAKPTSAPTTKDTSSRIPRPAEHASKTGTNSALKAGSTGTTNKTSSTQPTRPESRASSSTSSRRSSLYTNVIPGITKAPTMPLPSRPTTPKVPTTPSSRSPSPALASSSATASSRSSSPQPNATITTLTRSATAPPFKLPTRTATDLTVKKQSTILKATDQTATVKKAATVTVHKPAIATVHKSSTTEPKKSTVTASTVKKASATPKKTSTVKKAVPTVPKISSKKHADPHEADPNKVHHVSAT